MPLASCFTEHLLDRLAAADVARVDAESVRTGLEGGKGKAVVKVDVRNQGPEPSI